MAHSARRSSTDLDGGQHATRGSAGSRQKDSSAITEPPRQGSAYSRSAGGNLAQAAHKGLAPLLVDDRFSQPMHARQRAQLVQNLQRDYGNQYVRRLVEHVQRNRIDGDKTPAQDETMEAGNSRTKDDLEQLVSLMDGNAESELNRPAAPSGARNADSTIQRETLAQVSGWTEKTVPPLTGKIGEKASDKKARSILEGAFESNWFYAKDVLLKGKWPSSIKDEEGEEALRDKQPAFNKVMDGLLGLRELEYNQVLEHIRDDVLPKKGIRDPEGKVVEKPEELLVWGASGSATRTSDIDVNLKGYGSIQAVALFNTLFKSNFGWPYEPGTVYDVNVYAKDYMVGKEGDPSSKNPMKAVVPDEKGTQATIVPNQEVALSGKAFEEFAKDQEIQALMHTRRYMTAPEWKQYVKDMAETDPDFDLVRKMNIANNRYLEYKATLDAQIEIIKSSTTQVFKVLMDALKASTNLSAADKEEAIAMQAANLIYSERLERVQQLRNDFEQLKARVQKGEGDEQALQIIGVQLKSAISEALNYANEVYVTQGAVHFSVIGQQIGATGMVKDGGKFEEVDIQLPKELFLHSFEEQVGDFMKATAHASDKDTFQARVVDDLEHGGKYLDRMVKSASKIVPDESEIPNFDILSRLGLAFFDWKFESGKAAENEEEVTPLSAALNESDISQLEKDGSLRSTVIAFSVNVNKAYRATDRDIKSQELTTTFVEPGSGSEPSEKETKASDRNAGIRERIRQLIENGMDISQKQK